MNALCRGCGKDIVPDSENGYGNIIGGICDACAASLSGVAGNSMLLESIDTPVLLMQGNPRQVVTANRQALALFDKKLREVEGHRGGQVFDCVHAFTEAGCGKDVNCEDCPIKNAIVETFTSGRPQHGIVTTLQLKKTSGTENRVVQVSTEKVGELALVRVERYDRCD